MYICPICLDHLFRKNAKPMATRCGTEFLTYRQRSQLNVNNEQAIFSAKPAYIHTSKPTVIVLDVDEAGWQRHGLFDFMLTRTQKRFRGNYSSFISCHLVLKRPVPAFEELPQSAGRSVIVTVTLYQCWRGVENMDWFDAGWYWFDRGCAPSGYHWPDGRLTYEGGSIPQTILGHGH